MYVCPDTSPKKEKVTAIDNYDGDISKKVKVNISKDKISYSVTDSNGNKTVVSKNIVYKDVEKPVITLVGDDKVTTFVDSEYVDDGYSVSDNCDSNLDGNVKVEGSVDTSKSGEYVLTYKVSDSAGNEGQITRVVNVLERSKGTIYLTFLDISPS